MNAISCGDINSNSSSLPVFPLQKFGKQIRLAKLLVIIGVIIMITSAIVEFIYGGDAFIASEILGLGLSQIGIVL